MKWKLFLDDDRYPTTNDWTIARNVDDAIWYVKNYGMPYHIAFDHDLGAFKQSGHDFAKWLHHHVYDKHIGLESFSYSVHSQNPPGVKNIKAMIDSMISQEKENR